MNVIGTRIAAAGKEVDMRDSDKQQGVTPSGPDSLSEVFKGDQSQGPNEPLDDEGRKRDGNQSERGDTEQVPVGGQHNQQNPQLKSETD
jgi:hypothetical protein